MTTSRYVSKCNCPSGAFENLNHNSPRPSAGAFSSDIESDGGEQHEFCEEMWAVLDKLFRHFPSVVDSQLVGSNQLVARKRFVECDGRPGKLVLHTTPDTPGLPSLAGLAVGHSNSAEGANTAKLKGESPSIHSTNGGDACAGHMENRLTLRGHVLNMFPHLLDATGSGISTSRTRFSGAE